MGSLAEIRESQDTSAKPYSNSYKVYVLCVMLVLYSLSWADRMLIGILAPLIKADLMLTDTELGIASGTAFAVSFVLFTVPLGWMADRFNRTWIMSSSLMLWSTCTALLGFASSAIFLIGCRLGLGAGESGGSAPAQSLLSDLFPPHQRARAMAVYSFGMTIGMAAGAVIGGALSHFIGWRMTFVAFGVAGIIVAIVLKLTVREPVRRAHGGLQSDPLPFVASIRAMLAVPGYTVFGAGVIFATVGMAGSNFWIPSYFQRSFDLDMADISLMFGAIQLAGGLLGGWAGAYISDRHVRSDPGAHAKVSAVAFLLVAPLFAGVILAPTSDLAFGFFFLVTFAQSASYGPSAAAVQQFAPMALRGTASAILNVSVVAIGMGVGVPAIGALSDLFAKTLGDRALGSVLLILTIFYLLAAALIWRSALKISDGVDARRVVT